MKLMFLNVWGEFMQETLPGFLAEHTTDIDVFCFQEATEEMKRRCASVLSDFKEISAYKYISAKDNFHQTIYVKNGIEIIGSDVLMAHESGAGLAIALELKKDGQTYHVCNVHGVARPKEKLDTPGRIRQSEILIKYYEHAKAPVIIGGDFNLEINTESVRLFGEHGYRDLIKDFKVPTTRNRLIWDRFPTNKMLYSDYVFLNDAAHCRSFDVVDNEVSDHLPLIVDVRSV